MKFIHLTDTSGRHHIINPVHITAIHEADAGCVVLMRGRSNTPITLNETVEVMSDALGSNDTDAELISTSD